MPDGDRASAKASRVFRRGLADKIGPWAKAQGPINPWENGVTPHAPSSLHILVRPLFNRTTFASKFTVEAFFYVSFLQEKSYV